MAPRRAVSETVQAGKAAVLLMSVGLLTGVSNLGFNVLVARRSGADAYGAFVALLTLSQIAGVLAVATNYTVARRVARADQLTGALIRRSLISSWPWLILSVGLFAVTPLLQGYVHLSSPAAVLTADAVFVVIVTAAVPNGILIGLRRFRTVAVINFVGALARLVVVPFLPTGPNATVGAIAASALPFLVIGPTALMVVLRSRHQAPTWQTARAGDQDSGPLSIETMGAALMAAMLWSLWTLPPLIARHSLAGSAAGDFSAAQLLAGGILFFSTPAITAFFPLMARGRNLRTAMLGLTGLLGLCAVGVVFLTLLGPRFMPLLFGSDYSAAPVLFAALGTSAALVAGATFCTWMTRAMSRLVWVAFAGSATAVVAELLIGLLLHPSTFGLALLPATAVVIGLAVVTSVVPEPVYSRAVSITRRALADRLGTIPRRQVPRSLGEPPTLPARPEVEVALAPAVSPAPIAATSQPLRWAAALSAPRYRLAAIVGIAAIAVVAITGETSAAGGLFAPVALAALLSATLLAIVACRKVPAHWEASRARARSWFWAFVVVAEFAIAAPQSWFKPGTAITGADLSPPDGTAWLTRIFDPWSWTGSDIGSAAANQRELPWAAVLGVVHTFGGSAALAQRIWYTLLFVGMGVAAVALLRTLGLRPVAAAVGALVYLFNPGTLITVPSDVFLLGMVLVPALAAIVLAAARGTLRIRTALVLMVLTVPLIGYMESQPALALMLAVAVLLCPILAAWLGGRDAFRRGLRVVGAGGLLMLLASAFWLVPAAIRTASATTAQLGGLGSWGWTEVRATIANGFWLNTTWGWNDPSVFPYSAAYSQQPLQTLKFALPVLAFAALLIPVMVARGSGSTPSRLRVSVAAAAIALFIIVFSTGTNPPGLLIFDPIYFHLPFGFLVREPDSHFMSIAVLAFAVLVAVGVDHVTSRFATARAGGRSLGTRVSTRIALVLAVVGVASLVPSYPLLTGAVLPDSRPGYPPRHVNVPGYWYDMAGFINAHSGTGDVLALPADHFYQVDYRWGYYGTDTFIQDLMSQRVVMALPQVYVTTSKELRDVVDQIDADIVAHRWSEVAQLTSALRTPYILVRGDVNPSFNGASSVPDPASLATALVQAPAVDLVYRAGPLELFRVNGVAAPHVQTTDAIATVSSDEPDLHVLPYLPAGTQLVTSPVRLGVASVTQVPSVTQWNDNGGYIATTVQEPPGWNYQVAWLNRDLTKLGTIGVSANGPFARLTIPTTDILANGDFTSGVWQGVGDCNGVNGFARAGANASVDPRGGPGGVPSLHLGAFLDSACEQQPLSWRGGSLLLSMTVRNDTGPAPRICLFEVGPNKCARTDSLPVSSAWTSYASAVTPDVATKGLVLYLLADGSGTEQATLDEFAGVRVRELPIAAPSLAVIGSPTAAPADRLQLVVQDDAYDQRWSGPSDAAHVVVDGMLNGWLTSDPAHVEANIRYGPATAVELSNVISIAAGVVTAGIALWMLPRRWRQGLRRRLRRRG